jgi:hypothetical protein
MMHTDLTYGLAEAHISELHREAANRRLARRATRSAGAGIGTSVTTDLAVTWAALTTWLRARAPRAAEPDCCPA